LLIPIGAFVINCKVWSEIGAATMRKASFRVSPDTGDSEGRNEYANLLLLQ